MTGNAAVSRFPASQLDARRAALADRCRVLPHLAEYLSEGLGYGNDVIALYLDAAAGIVHTIGDAPEGSDDYRVTALPARDWLLSLDLDADFADEWRGCGEFPPAAPDGPQLHVPASLFLGEADAVLAAAGLPVPPPTPPEDLGQVQGLAAALVELVDTYPTDSPAAPVYPLTLTDPASGRARTILLQPGQVAWLAELVRAELTTCHEAQGGTGACGHCGPTPDDGGNRRG
ncbi:hypothetical protein [Microbispora sp. NBRC 16548]|uniref:hypothetical protein n=1 Tax=Microbispora sp. NBRC 16548 TaxID=3030994 RepID=UPI00161BA936|nr:hypothetical protein [Microbispora sp. NBRC 16548]GLX06754.1 hypothetical protein Misp03_36810 [Microbispora sp. NBRC 16548]